MAPSPMEATKMCGVSTAPTTWRRWDCRCATHCCASVSAFFPAAPSLSYLKVTTASSSRLPHAHSPDARVLAIVGLTSSLLFYSGAGTASRRIRGFGLPFLPKILRFAISRLTASSSTA